MFGGAILDAICKAQETIGVQMASDSISSENLSELLVHVSQAWAGTTINSKSQVPTDGDMPISNAKPEQFYTTAQIQFMVSYLAGMEKSATGDKLKQYQAESSAWTNLGSAMGNLASLQKSPISTMQQGESSQIQQDQSAVSSSSQLGNGLADLDGIPASLLPSIGS